MTPNFHFIPETSKSLSVRNRSLKEIYRVENFRANVLRTLEIVYTGEGCEMNKQTYRFLLTWLYRIELNGPHTDLNTLTICGTKYTHVNTIEITFSGWSYIVSYADKYRKNGAARSFDTRQRASPFSKG